METLLLVFSAMIDLFLLCVPPIILVVTLREIKKMDSRFWRWVARVGLIYVLALIYVMFALVVITQVNDGRWTGLGL